MRHRACCGRRPQAPAQQRKAGAMGITENAQFPWMLCVIPGDSSMLTYVSSVVGALRGVGGEGFTFSVPRNGESVCLQRILQHTLSAVKMPEAIRAT
jgi:hypothetical protein